MKALPPSSSEELPDVEKEREAAVADVVLRSVEVEDNASIGASGALETATDAALLRLPKSAFISMMLGGVGGGLDAGDRTREQEVLLAGRWFLFPFFLMRKRKRK